MPTGIVLNKASLNCCLLHLLQLRAFPSIWVREHKSDIVLNRLPEVGPIAMCLFDVIGGTAEKVSEKVGEDLHDCLIEWQRGDIAIYCARLVSEVQYEPCGHYQRSRL